VKYESGKAVASVEVRNDDSKKTTHLQGGEIGNNVFLAKKGQSSESTTTSEKQE